MSASLSSPVELGWVSRNLHTAVAGLKLSPGLVVCIFLAWSASKWHTIFALARTDRGCLEEMFPS